MQPTSARASSCANSSLDSSLSTTPFASGVQPSAEAGADLERNTPQSSRTELAGYPGWSLTCVEDEFREGTFSLSFFYRNVLAGNATAVVLHVRGRKNEDVLERLIGADTYCIQDELEAWLTENPGKYVWLDELRRTSEAPEVKGTLTKVLRAALTHARLGLFEYHVGLAFPCPYGGDEGQEGRAKLTRWYQSQMDAVPLNGTPFVRFLLA